MREIVSAESVFEESSHAIGIEVDVGLSSEQKGVAGGGVAPASGAGAP